MLDEAIERGVERALKKYTKMQPLMTEDDVCKTLGIGRTTFARNVQPHLPPLWIGGSKRWHPGTVEAYIRSRAGKRKC